MCNEDQTKPAWLKPIFHIAPPTGWINDPCAPGFDPRTSLYHLFYQWNPKSHVWGDISWGHLTSRDLINWKLTSDKPVLSPDQEYDSRGVFTGCFFPTGPYGDIDQLSVIYTSVNNLPITWSEPYTRGCEGLAMACSQDDGITWVKHRNNPIVTEEPPGIHVTGFRDPFLSQWTAMDLLRGTTAKLYGLVAGGIHGEGPRIFLYEVSPTDLTSWSYVSPLMRDIPPGYKHTAKWAGDFGVNWECANFITLENQANGLSREVIIVGSEGGNEREWITEWHKGHPAAARRTPRYANWFFGELKIVNGDPEMSMSSAGLLDWGLAYAASTFKASDGRTIMWSWLIEEDLLEPALADKGWTGCLAVPKELFLARYEGVIGGLRTDLKDLGSFQSIDDSGLAVTLGIRPIREMDSLRAGIAYCGQSGPLSDVHIIDLPLACDVNLLLQIRESTRSISLRVRESANGQRYTSIVIDLVEETISVGREKSTSRSETNLSPEIGSFTLLRMQEAGNERIIEPLKLRVLIDHDVIEIFANDRFAISTRVYSEATANGLSLSSDGLVYLSSFQVWEMGPARVF